MKVVQPPLNLKRDEALTGQIYIGKNAPENMQTWAISDIKVGTYGQNDPIAIKDSDNNLIGYAFGLLINAKSNCIVTSPIILNTRGQSLDDAIEDRVYQYGGRFLFLIVTDQVRRLYLDANGTQPIVYDPHAQQAGSTAGMLLDDQAYKDRFDAALFENGDLAHDGWLPAGLTPHTGIKRLLCNHYLDLDTWTQHRHWCATPNLSPNTDETFKQITREIQGSLRALMSHGDFHISLTAGSETRALLACARPMAQQLQFYTVQAPSNNVDVHVARKIARKFNLKHQIIPFVEATPDQQNLWHYRGGHQVSGTNLRMHPSVWQLPNLLRAGGLGGEIGRAFLWKDATPTAPITVDDLLTRLKLPNNAVIRQNVQNWLQALPISEPSLVLDMAYIELRMGSWGFAHAHANPREFVIHPMTSRRMFNLMLSLPADMRRNNGLITGLVKQNWPELLEIPINRYGNFLDKIDPLQRAISNPRRAWRKVQQILRRKISHSPSAA